MTSMDEYSIQQAEIRHQYNLMMELKTLMNKQKERLDLQIRENYVSLINRKRSLYPQWIFGFVDFNNGVRMVNSYLQKLNRKEIRRSQKCEERTYHDLMCDHIKSETGIAVKSIDEVVFYGYEQGYIIYFTDEKYGKHLRWQIPNLKNPMYNPKMYYPMEFGKDTTPNFENLLDDLDMKLCIVTERTETCIKLEEVASFPNDVTKLEDFGKKFEESVKGG